MAEERDEMLLQPRKICTWMLNLAFATILFAVLFKVMILSQDVEDSRRMQKELSSNLSKIQRENEYLRKELSNTKTKVENIVRKFSKDQKVADVRRSAAKRNAQAEPRCRHKILTCLKRYIKVFLAENPLNCSTIRHCMPPPERKKDIIQVYELDAAGNGNQLPLRKNAGFLSVAWQRYQFADTGNVVLETKQRIRIHRGGIYFIYCNLRVGSQYVDEVFIWSKHNGNEKTLFSTKIDYTNTTYDVKLFGQANILNGTELYVKLKPGSFIPKKDIYSLFPGFTDDNSVAYNNFGVFLFS